MGIAFMSFMGIKYGKEVVEEETPTEATAEITDQQLENK
jgi:hypothetical protein